MQPDSLVVDLKTPFEVGHKDVSYHSELTLSSTESTKPDKMEGVLFGWEEVLLQRTCEELRVAVRCFLRLGVLLF